MMSTKEKDFNSDRPDGWAYYWWDIRKKERIFSKRNFGGDLLIIWGGFFALGILDLAFPTTRMNSTEYQTILSTNLTPFSVSTTLRSSP
ncbi:hypothetical protein WR25_10605 [Diploscapter pachys]|uniref:Uncharacterized protein n=1 Tax=Diploscapter pachys TaxID=2018661 RepID=A0A2A2JFI8_9BILA|nr:hypothetical protein WR25_10605 [Diploscapter pachys]